MVSATTPCASIDLPYSENFEGYVGTTYSNPAGVAPDCWKTSGGYYGLPHITGSGSYHYVHSGTNSLTFTSGNDDHDAYAVLPTFSQPLNTLTLSFWRAMEDVTKGVLTVGYVTNYSNAAGSFVPVATIPSLASNSGDTIRVDFTGAGIPANGNICFRWRYAGSSFYTCCIDDIGVTSNVAPCATITLPYFEMFVLIMW